MQSNVLPYRAAPGLRSSTPTSSTGLASGCRKPTTRKSSRGTSFTPAAVSTCLDWLAEEVRLPQQVGPPGGSDWKVPQPSCPAAWARSTHPSSSASGGNRHIGVEWDLESGGRQVLPITWSCDQASPNTRLGPGPGPACAVCPVHAASKSVSHSPASRALHAGRVGPTPNRVHSHKDGENPPPRAHCGSR